MNSGAHPLFGVFSYPSVWVSLRPDQGEHRPWGRTMGERGPPTSWGDMMSTITWRRLAWPGPVRERLTGARRDNGQLTFGLSSVVVRAVTALGVAGAALAAALVLQGPAAEGPSDAALSTRLATSAGTLDVGTPSVTLVHQPNEMVGMPASAAHRSGGEVLVPVTLTNTSDRPIRYAASQFHLVVDGETVDAGGEAAVGSGQELRPDAAITLRLTFTDVSLVHGGQLRYESATGAFVTAPLEAVAESTPTPTASAGGSIGGSTAAAGNAGHEHGTR
jgi:hypothetical protein